jgi:hypothetical protein
VLITLPKESGPIIVKLFQTPLGILKKDIMNIDKLDNTELIRTSLSPDERTLPFQLLNLF